MRMTSAAPDTIVAVASPAGRGAIGVIRVSGAAVPRVAGEILGALPRPRHAVLATFRDREGRPLDQGLALYFPAPASFTGEHVLELQGHGGTVVLDMLVQRLLALGCRMARPGEFSERAFLNGKMDMAQAEAVADLIDAGTAAAARAAVRSLQGEFSARIQVLQSQLTELRMHVEAAIDFPEEEIDFLTGPAFTGRVARVFDSLASIKSAARQGALLREGVTMVIAGKPNAGKSSLLNRLVGDAVAIVANAPGTTRDLLRHHLHLDGLPLTLIDTAGLRDSSDPVEQEGVRRARAAMQRADRVLYVLDGSADAVPRPAGLPELPGVPVTLIFNKIDLTGGRARAEDDSGVTRLFISALTGAGLDLLRSHLKAVAGYHDSETGVFSARRRHLDALERADTLVRTASENLHGQRAFELFAEDLRLAQQALGEITGEFTTDDLLGKIFGSFCIGK